MQSIIRGTNAIIQIKITDDIDFSKLSSVYLSIYQPGRHIIKTQENLIIDDEEGTVTYKTTQEESFSLSPNMNAEITMWGLLDGDAFETRPVLIVKVENSRRGEVL